MQLDSSQSLFKVYFYSFLQGFVCVIYSKSYFFYLDFNVEVISLNVTIYDIVYALE